MKLSVLLRKVKNNSASSEELQECFNRCDNLLGFTKLRNKIVIEFLKNHKLYKTFNNLVYGG